MNVEQQQYPPPPAALLTPTNYHQYDASTTAAATSTATMAMPAAMPQPPTTTTYVTIGVLPQQGYHLNAAAGAGAATTTAATTPTSSFKTTPLLPMPTLEDIECGGGGIMLVSGAPDGNSILPPGILKYSSMAAPAFTTTSMPMMAAPAVGATLLSYSTAAASSPPPTLLTASPPQLSAATDACGTLKSNNKLLGTLSGTQQRMTMAKQQQQQQQQPPPPTAGMLSTSSTIASNIAVGSNNCSTSAINNAGGSVGAAAGVGVGVGGSNSSTNSKRHKTRRKCCACFGRSHDGGGGADGSSRYSSTTKKTKKSQTLWAGVLTNLGICALLLAYTLLGSFIFLTIENEDSSLLHQQRTLASTKRVASADSGSGHGSGRGSGSESGRRNIYHTQPHHLDNGTVAAVSYTSSSSSASASSSTSSSSSSSSAGISAMNGNHEFGISDSQLALSADTFDVRQRTIENIWDITVSLNILYKENWTKLAAMEIAKFQDQLVKRLNEDVLLQLSHDIDANGNGNGNSPATEAVLLLSHQHGVYGHQQHEWNFAKAFLYSLTVLTTIGYGNIAPKTTLGRLVTLAYAILGIPLTLVYLSSTGGILAKVAREVFSKALCCCLCSNCGYCCYDEKRMAEKERRMKRKRQQEELRKQHAAMQEPYYVRSGSLHSSFQSPEKHAGSNTPMMSGGGTIPDMDSLSASESRGSMHGLSILAPILLCLSMMIIYILFGAMVLYRMENWPLLDGVYFCFMSLSTIGFGDLVPGLRKESTATTWFCSIYIMSGMALTAMCFNVIHEEIVHRIKIVVEFKKGSTLDSMNDEQSYYMAPPPS